MNAPPHPDQPTQVPALTKAVLEIERHVAQAGWNAPLFMFALVKTANALRADPRLAADLGPELTAAAQADPEHLLSIQQEGLPEADSIEELLGQLHWGEAVDGVALVCERLVLPPEVENQVPRDPDEALEFLQNHPARQSIRLAVGVLRDGQSACAVRSQANDNDACVGTDPDMAPGIIHALRETLV